MLLSIVFGSGLFALVFAAYLAWQVNKEELGTPKMKKIYEAIRLGSRTYLRRQYKLIVAISLVLTVLLYFAFDYGKQPLTSMAFMLGAVCSLVASYVSMDVATKANVRTAFAAKKNMSEPLRISFYGGLVLGLFNVGLSLLGVTGLYYLYGGNPTLLVGFGFGASLSALFAQLGGGIYTKAADVGADLVGKLEEGIPEDDPRNPAVIADNVGDNVGDIAGRGADLFESLTGENIAAMIIGFTVYSLTGNIYFVLFPILARAVGIFATILGIPFVKAKGKFDPIVPLRNGAMATIVFGIIGFYFLIQYTLNSMNLFYAGLAGLVASVLIILTTEYYTAKNHRPIEEIALASKTGAGTNLITGYAFSLESTALPVIIIVAAILASYHFGTLFAAEVAIGEHLGGVYGTAVATMGMLSIAGMILGLDGFGPIVDNAGGILEMSHADKKVRDRIDEFDAAGNTTKALTKGYAMAAAGISALLVFQAYLEVAGMEFVDITSPTNIAGLFFGALIPFVFASFAMRAVGKAAYKIIEEVRRQFREIPGLRQGKADPDYSQCVDISTVAAQKGMIVPGLIAVAAPLAVGFIFGAGAAGAFIMGSIISGFILAMQMNTGGAAWDNAKKYIEAGKYGGKGSVAHKAAVVGDTVGDPFKDTAGPSLHILIKLMSNLALVFAQMFVLYALL